MFSGFAFETIRLAFKSIRLHKLRSLLTTLGIICGVGAVICMLSIAEGASEAEMAMIRLLGTQNIIVRSIKPDTSQDVSAEQSYMLTYGLTARDLRRIKATLPGIEDIVPLREVANNLRYGPKQCAATVVGTEPTFFNTIHVDLAQGIPLQSYHQEKASKVCVIGDDVRKALFAFENPLGQSITVDGGRSGLVPFEVIGVLARIETAGSPAKGLGSRDMNDEVYVPFSAADARYGDIQLTIRPGSEELTRVEFSDLYVKVEKLENVLSVAKTLQRVLEHGHNQEDFVIRVPLERLQIVEKEKERRRITLGAIAGVSLLVGGIGIMNIMLATVTERTREIGIRRALGAKRKHITMQFLLESITLTTLGGLLGIAIGWLGAYLITMKVGWPTVVHGWSVVISFGLAVSVGVFFGIYPAAAAARLDPIEALRHE